MLIRNKYLLQFFKYKRKVITENVLGNNCRHTHQTRFCSSKLNVLFFGTDNFSLPSLRELHNNRAQNNESALGVVTSFKSPANSIRQYAEKENLPLYSWPVDADVCRKYDLGVVVSFGHMIPEKIINAFPRGMINVHASLLPRWRGAAPIIYALMHGEATTGVSIMKIEPKHFDVGDILAQREVAIRDNVLMPELHEELATVGSHLLLDVVRDFPASVENAQKQNDKEATYAPKITPSITEVLWNAYSSQAVYNRYRALYGFKNLTTRFEGRNVQLIDIRPRTTTSSLNLSVPGEFAYDKTNKCLVVQCADCSSIEVHQLRIEGKKVMNARDFNNGFLKKLKGELRFTSNKKC